MIAIGLTHSESMSNPDGAHSGPEHAGRLFFVLLLLSWATIPIGSNRPWSVAILEFGTLSIIGSWCLAFALNPFTLPSAARRARIPLALMLVWALYPLLQLVPLPASWVSALSLGHETPYREHLFSADSEISYLTVDRNATLAGFLWQASLVAMFCCVLLLVTTARRMRMLLIIMFLVGFFQALYGLAIYFGGVRLGIWNPGYSEGTVSGTYVNQNHFAGLMELTIPIGLGLLLYAGRDWRPPTESARFLPSILAFLSGKSGILLFCTLVMTAALILTTSRGGIGSLAVGVTVAIILAVAKRGMRTRETILGMVIIALTVTALIWIGPGKLVEKIEASGLASKRGDLRDISYQIISDRPVFGTGVGTYRWVFPAYKDDRFGGNFYEHAHNDLLEVIGEQGIMGFAFLASGVLIVFVRMVRAFGKTQDLLMRGALFAAISGTMALSVHGLVDFNLHIPANALFFVVLLGIGAVACDMVEASSPDRGVSAP